MSAKLTESLPPVTKVFEIADLSDLASRISEQAGVVGTLMKKYNEEFYSSQGLQPQKEITDETRAELNLPQEEPKAPSKEVSREELKTEQIKLLKLRVEKCLRVLDNPDLLDGLYSGNIEELEQLFADAYKTTKAIYRLIGLLEGGLKALPNSQLYSREEECKLLECNALFSIGEVLTVLNGEIDGKALTKENSFLKLADKVDEIRADEKEEPIVGILKKCKIDELASAPFGIMFNGLSTPLGDIDLATFNEAERTYLITELLKVKTLPNYVMKYKVRETPAVIQDADAIFKIMIAIENGEATFGELVAYVNQATSV